MSLKQLLAVDHSARTSMKSAANCVTWCELQDTLIIDISNATGGQAPRGLGRVRLRVGKRFKRVKSFECAARNLF